MSLPDDSCPEDDPILREALKRCSPSTYYAACKFKKSGLAADLSTVVLGIMERFVERELRTKLSEAPPALRLREELGLDSLTMMEIVMLTEEVLGINVSNEELTQLRTLGDVQAFLLAKTAAPATRRATASNAPNEWNISAVAEDVRRIESNAAQST